MAIRTKSGETITQAQAISRGVSGTYVKPSAVTRPRSGGGRITVTKSGKVTETLPSGEKKVYQTSKKTAERFIKRGEFEAIRGQQRLKERLGKKESRLSEINRLLKSKGVITEKGKKELRAEKRRLELEKLSKEFVRVKDIQDVTRVKALEAKQKAEAKRLSRLTASSYQQPKPKEAKGLDVEFNEARMSGVQALSEKLAKLEPIAREAERKSARANILLEEFSPSSLLEATQLKAEAARDLVLFKATRGVAGAIGLGLQPVKTTKETAKAFTKPETYKRIVRDLKVDPLGTVAEFYTFSKTIGVPVKILKASPAGRVLAMERYIKEFPKSERPFVRSVVYSSEFQRKIKPVDPKTLKDVNFYDVKELSKVEARALKKAASKGDAVVFGSKSARVLSGKATKIPKDVDLAVSDPVAFAKEFINSLPKSERGKYTIRGESVVRKADGVKILDVKPSSRLTPGVGVSGRGKLPVSGFEEIRLSKIKNLKGSDIKIEDFGVLTKEPVSAVKVLQFPTEKTVKVGELEFVSFGEQTTRKGLGTLQTIVEGKGTRRAKDPAAFLESLEVQAGALRGRDLGLIDFTRLKVIESSLKRLKSFEFQELLERRVPGISKEYPIKYFSEAELKRLSKIGKRVGVSESDISLLSDLRRGSYLPRLKDVSSYLPKALTSSQLPLIRSSSITPSKLPSGKLSFIPSSRFESVIPKSKISKLPTSTIPASKLPSSKITVSKLPTSTIPASKLPSSKIPSGKVEPLPVKVLKMPTVKSVKSNKPGFNVEYKRGGKWRSVKSNIPKSSAEKYARFLAENSVARSYRVRKSGRKADKDVKGLPNISSKQFRTAKRGKDVRVERSKFAINTFGEKSGLRAARLAKRSGFKVGKSSIPKVKIKVEAF